MAKKNETIYLKIPEGIPAERAIRKFKRLCDMYEIVKEYRKREQYDKPSVRAKEKKESADKRRVKNQRRSFHQHKKL